MSFALPVAVQHLRSLIEEGLSSGPAQARSSKEVNELRAVARGESDLPLEAPPKSPAQRTIPP